MNDWDMQPAKDLHLTGIERSRSYVREAGLSESLIRWCWLCGLRNWFCRWNGLKIEGLENLPSEPPYVLIANHASHLDALVMASIVPRQHRDRMFALAAADVFFENPLTAAFAASVVNALPVWRKGNQQVGLKQMRERLQDEKSIYILFPEGARTRDGNLLPFKPGIGMLLAETGTPILPCYLNGTFESLPAHQKFPSRHPITVTVGQSIDSKQFQNRKAGWVELANTLKETIQEMSGKPAPEGLG
ncbi:MAG: 1-acyl-sn-glycerol-3-phosphate acyltransferase [Planctomycetaceae bacterium]|nr:1-acyl-sn-glycerol-3-phosphate acyltransferase [Planctomycetaceae bacterium]